MSVNLTGKVGLVTGGANGIGRAAVVALARAGASVVVVDQARQADSGRLVAEEAGNGSLFVAADVTSPTDWERVIAETLAISGRLDFAHNNAGIGLARSLRDTTPEEFDAVFSVNVRGVWLGMQAQLAVMSDQGSGAIVNTSSLAGLRGLAEGSAYSASKHAVIGLTKSAALEYAAQEIRVNVVCPAATDTAMTRALPDELRQMIVAPQAMRRFADPAEIGAVVAWLCSDSSTFITGAVVPVDGGATAS